MRTFLIAVLALFFSGCNSMSEVKERNRFQFAELLINQPEKLATETLFDDQMNSIWVDWGEDDVTIVNLTERILSTGTLSAELVLENSKQLKISYDGKEYLFPLIMDNTMQHIALLRLNEVLNPQYEMRMAWHSDGSDTLAMVPLSTKQWKVLEKKYGEQKIAHTFLKLTPHPNIFTESLVRP